MVGAPIKTWTLAKKSSTAKWIFIPQQSLVFTSSSRSRCYSIGRTIEAIVLRHTMSNDKIGNVEKLR